LRDAIAANEEALLTIALRPDMPPAELQLKLKAPRGKQSFSNVLRKTLKLPPVAISLLQEAAVASRYKLSGMSAAGVAALINAVPLCLTGTSPIASAISTAGGVPFDEVDEHFMLKQRPGVFVAGEMLDWEAPTGGYLLQASFATGVATGKGTLAHLRR
jgi:predicted flavoprotein YhiN